MLKSGWFLSSLFSFSRLAPFSGSQWHCLKLRSDHGSWGPWGWAEVAEPGVLLGPLQGLGPITGSTGPLTPFPYSLHSSSHRKFFLFLWLFFFFSGHVFFPFALVTSSRKLCWFFHAWSRPQGRRAGPCRVWSPPHLCDCRYPCQFSPPSHWHVLGGCEVKSLGLGPSCR